MRFLASQHSCILQIWSIKYFARHIYFVIHRNDRMWIFLKLLGIELQLLYAVIRKVRLIQQVIAEKYGVEKPESSVQFGYNLYITCRSLHNGVRVKYTLLQLVTLVSRSFRGTVLIIQQNKKRLIAVTICGLVPWSRHSQNCTEIIHRKLNAWYALVENICNNEFIRALEKRGCRASGIDWTW